MQRKNLHQIRRNSPQGSPIPTACWINQVEKYDLGNLWELTET